MFYFYFLYIDNNTSHKLKFLYWSVSRDGGMLLTFYELRKRMGLASIIALFCLCLKKSCNLLCAEVQHEDTKYCVFLY